MSFSYQPDNRRSVYLNFIGSLESQLRDAYAKRCEAGEETQASLANKLGVHRSVVNRRLSGGVNMTIETLSDMIWALGNCVEVRIFDPHEHPTNQRRVVPNPVPSVTYNAANSSGDMPVIFSAQRREAGTSEQASRLLVTI